MSQYHEKFIKALRDTLPISKHPSKDLYTLSQLRALFYPNMCPYDCGEYGDEPCICGHDIKYCYEVIYIYNATIKVKPIGSECITEFFSPYEVCLKTIIDKINLKRLWNGEYTTKDVCRANGFSSDTMVYLDTNVLSTYEFSFLLSLVKARKKQYLTEKQIRFMYRIMKRIQEYYSELKKQQLTEATHENSLD